MYYQSVTRHEKALVILRLAREMMCRTQGVTLSEIMEMFSVSRRTAERMRDAVLSIYPDTEETWDADSVKRWHIPCSPSDPIDPLQSVEIAALHAAIAALQQTGQFEQAQRVEDLALKVQQLLPRKVRNRIEPDLEVLMMSEGLAQRPGPRPKIEPTMLASVRDAILGCQRVSFAYVSRISGAVTTRTVDPYGILYGLRPYLLGWDQNAEPEGFRLFSLSDITDLVVTKESFQRQEGFTLKDYAERSFGAFQEPPVDVVWRVSPRAAADARTWLFHPTQTLEDQPDGSLIVRFRAGGLLEMCWHLFTWGGEIEILEPQMLKLDMKKKLAKWI